MGIPLMGLSLLALGRPLLESSAAFFIRHFLLGDAAHPQSLSFYLSHVPQKLEMLALNLNLTHPRVFLPILFSGILLTTVGGRPRWELSHLKIFLLLLVLADLFAFRMPLGNAFYKPSDITAPQIPAPENQTLTLLYNTPSPLPNQYGEMAYPNMNIAFNRPNLVFDANPTPRRYANIWARLGWFSWVYKDRDPLGFSHNSDLLQMLGVDQIVSDTPLNLPSPFTTVQNRYPFVYHLADTMPKAFIGITNVKSMRADPLKFKIKILEWNETRLSLIAIGVKEELKPDLLFLQKTFLPGWKAYINGKTVEPNQYFEDFMSLPISDEENQVELRFESTGLRLGFFMFFTFFGVFSFFLIRRILA